MDFTPAWLCTRECLDCTLQRAVRARRTRLVPRRIRARQKRLQRLSRHSDTSDCSERLSKKERSDPNSVPTSSNLVSRDLLKSYERGLYEHCALHAGDPHWGGMIAEREP
jgi:hypothetical protein